MIICQYKNCSIKDSLKFTVIFEGTHETEMLQLRVDDSEGSKNFEDVLYELIIGYGR